MLDGTCSSCLKAIASGRNIPGSPEYKAARAEKDQWGEKNSSWKGGRHVDRFGYIWLRVPREDQIGQTMLTSRTKRYVQEHRLVMARYIGRPLQSEEAVHHINGIKDDNRIENLKLFATHREHFRFVHLAECPHCGGSLR